MATNGYASATSPAMDNINENTGYVANDLFDDDDMDGGSDASPFGESFNMPSEADDAELGGILAEGGAEGASLNLDEIHNRDLDQSGKDEDAVDYGDISDDDLADEEDATGSQQGGPVQRPELSGILEYAVVEDDDDDLFGDGPSSPAGEKDGQPRPTQDGEQEDGHSDLASEHEDDMSAAAQAAQDLDDAELQQYRIQKALFESSGQAAPATHEENLEEWIKHDFPSYDRNDTPFFHRLFPPKPRQYIGKTPLKPPKPIRPTKVNLELDQDQKNIFNSAVPVRKRPYQGDDSVIVIDVPQALEATGDDSAEDSDLDEPLPGGVSMQDLEIMCADFDTLSEIGESNVEAEEIQIAEDDADMFGYDLFEESARPQKKRKLGLDPHDIVSVRQLDMPSFDDPERLTNKLARHVVLDLNDPQLLVEEIALEAVRAKNQASDITKAKTLEDVLRERFNHSNDAEYDLLKQNNKSKIRGNLTEVPIEHSAPALRLQYPYYRVKLEVMQARKFHRPTITFQPFVNVSLTKPDRTKRKHLKGRKTKETFNLTKDLSLGDNSTAVLLEYSEEHPMIISQTGMGVKIVNFYRRRNKDDTNRPKTEVGETSILQPEDKSPFFNFGHIDPGEASKALLNSMYRAPLFDQEPRNQDFMVVRSKTGQDGSQYFLRKVDHLFAVGQEFPAVTVPGPHSRVVTTTSKNRLKAVSFRIARRKKSQRLRVEDVTKHFPDTTDMQNRQKMKEFMGFSKEHKEWEMRNSQEVPGEEEIQSLITPENICLLEAMQVGQQYLHDAGYGGEDDDDDDGKDGVNQTLEQELAPWRTSKNFKNATESKAMLQLFGEGDPSGRGEAFSFIKTSMKGGFEPVGESVMDKLTEKRELGGHSYNVARQQRAYDDSIRRIWEAQKASLSSNIDHSDGEMDDGVDGGDENVGNTFRKPPTGRSQNSTPAPSRRHDDETATSFSKRSNNSQSNRVLRIKRIDTQTGQANEEIVEDPAIIKQYRRKRQQLDLQNST